MKLTTTRLFVGLFALTAVAVIAGLMWLSGHEEEDRTVRGPSQIMQRMKQRQRQLMEEEARSSAQALENATHDLGLSGASAK